MPQKCVSPIAHRVAAISLLLIAFVSLVAFAYAAPQETEQRERREYPQEREQWFLRGRTVNGKPAPQLLQRAQQQRETMRKEAVKRAQVRTAATAGSGTPAPVWTPLGPAPLRSVNASGDQQDYGFVTGRATAVVVDQND